MLRLDLSLDDPAANLALDESLLNQVEAGHLGDLLRLWQFNQPVVVLGRSSKYWHEIQPGNCRERGVPVLRRNSGGGAILAGPGCLLYSLVLHLETHPELRGLNALHAWVMTRVVRALSTLLPDIQWQGTCDVTQGLQKVSGNSVRIGREAVLYHGTVLCGMDLSQTETLLGTAVRQPAYRAERSHREFISNLTTPATFVAEALAAQFDANELLQEIPLAEAEALAANRYRDPAWTERH